MRSLFRRGPHASDLTFTSPHNDDVFRGREPLQEDVMLKEYFVSPQRMQELREGRGGALLEGFSQALNRSGSAKVTARRHIRAAEHLIYWAETECLSADTPNEEIL